MGVSYDTCGLYAKFTAAQTVVVVFTPWQFSMCPDAISTIYALTYPMSMLLYMFAQAALMVTSLKRLRFVSATAAAERGRKLLMAVLMGAFCVLVLGTLWMMTPGFPLAAPQGMIFANWYRSPV